MIRSKSQPMRTWVGKRLYSMRHSKRCDYCEEVEGQAHVIVRDTRVIPEVRYVCSICELRIKDKNEEAVFSPE